MSKTIKNVWNEKFTMDKFLEAHMRAQKGKMSDKEVLTFEMDLETNIMNLMKKN